MASLVSEQGLWDSGAELPRGMRDHPRRGSGRQMVNHRTVGEYQADERAGVARLSWRVSGR